MQELQCWTGRIFLADFPFLKCGKARIQQGCKDSLADMRFFTDLTDFFRLHGQNPRPISTHARTDALPATSAGRVPNGAAT